MTKVLITGATGNVGRAVLQSLQNINLPFQVYAGVRDLVADKRKLAKFNSILVSFDFFDISSCLSALSNCDILFLLRPPQIAAVEKHFAPIIEACKEKGVKHIVFLSVQGVEKSKLIPHHPIERLIVNSKIPYTFLRPAYFMQNFTTTLHKDLVNKKEIYLPAGNAKFTLIDVADIGEVFSNILVNLKPHINQSYELTSKDQLTFGEMAGTMSNILETRIRFRSPNLLGFFLTKRKEKVPTPLILVMIMLHYLPRFQKAPAITNWVEKITGRPPTSFEQFVQGNKNELLGNVNN